jgi:hypothetical protein
MQEVHLAAVGEMHHRCLKWTWVALTRTHFTPSRSAPCLDDGRKARVERGECRRAFLLKQVAKISESMTAAKGYKREKACSHASQRIARKIRESPEPSGSPLEGTERLQCVSS